MSFSNHIPQNQLISYIAHIHRDVLHNSFQITNRIIELLHTLQPTIEDTCANATTRGVIISTERM